MPSSPPLIPHGISRLSSVKPLEESINRFIFLRALGVGSFGKVQLAMDTKRVDKVALKIISKNINYDVAFIQREISILRLLYHPNIVSLFDVFVTLITDIKESKHNIIISMEFVDGPDLLTFVHRNGPTTDTLGRHIFRQVVSAVGYCHSNCIIHRDLKPENILIDRENEVKVIDFGFVDIFQAGNRMNVICGSPRYICPEMMAGKEYTGPEVDVYGLGIVLYTTLVGDVPFKDNDYPILRKNILAGEYSIPSRITASAQDLIRQTLVVDPLKRLTVEQVMSHQWTIEEYDGPPETFFTAVPVEGKQQENTLMQLADLGFDSNIVLAKMNEADQSALSIYCLTQDYVNRQSLEQIAGTKSGQGAPIQRDRLSRSSRLPSVTMRRPTGGSEMTTPENRSLVSFEANRSRLTGIQDRSLEQFRSDKNSLDVASTKTLKSTRKVNVFFRLWRRLLRLFSRRHRRIHPTNAHRNSK